MDMEKDGKKAMKRLAANKAKKKMTKTSKVGKMLDDKEMMNAPRRRFLETMKDSRKPEFFETMKDSRKPAFFETMKKSKKGKK
jgi:Mg/Co/Ni transporter MgtE